MIYFSEKEKVLFRPNIIRLDLINDSGYIYVTRNTYDQALLLAEKCGYDLQSVMRSLALSNLQSGAVSKLFELLPRPINMLAPFLNLIDGTVTLDVNDTEQLIGVLSYISTIINFNEMLNAPKELRTGITYTKSILYNYQTQYNDFETSYIEHITPVQQVTAPTVNPIQMVMPEQEIKEQVLESGSINSSSENVVYTNAEYDAWVAETMAALAAEEAAAKANKEHEAGTTVTHESTPDVVLTDSDAYNDIIKQFV